MEVVIKQSELKSSRVTYQAEIPLVAKCRECKADATLMMQVHDSEKELVKERPVGAGVWPHDSLVI